MENFGIGPMPPGFVPGRYVVQGVMQNWGKTGLKVFPQQSMSRLKVYLPCYPTSISIILVLEGLVIAH